MCNLNILISDVQNHFNYIYKKIYIHFNWLKKYPEVHLTLGFCARQLLLILIWQIHGQACTLPVSKPWLPARIG